MINMLLMFITAMIINMIMAMIMMITSADRGSILFQAPFDHLSAFPPTWSLISFFVCAEKRFVCVNQNAAPLFAEPITPLCQKCIARPSFVDAVRAPKTLHTIQAIIMLIRWCW